MSASTFAQTAKSKRDQSINEARAKNFVQKFDDTVLESKESIQQKLEKNKARKRAIFYVIEQSDLKEKKKQKLIDALERKGYSTQLSEFVAQNKEQIAQFLEEDVDAK